MNTAVVFNRERYKLTDAVDARGQRIRVHTGTDTVRRAKCPHHDRDSEQFVGVGDALWIFACKYRGITGLSMHYFTAWPPKEAVTK